MKTIYKSTLLAVACLLLSQAVISQVTRTDYFMKSSFLRSSMNPALRPDQGYLVIPVLPTVGVEGNTNTLNLDNLTFAGVDGTRNWFFDSSANVNDEDFLSNIEDDNYVNVDAKYKVFGLGFYKGKGFWSIDADIKAHVEGNAPKEYFRLLKQGFTDNETAYNLKDLSASGTAHMELAVAYSRPMFSEYLVLGIRGKVLLGGGDFDLRTKNLTIQTSPEEWKITTQIEATGYAPGIKAVNDADGVFDEFEFDGFGVPGYGFGADLGAEFDLGKYMGMKNSLKVSAALTDLGFMTWSKNSSVKLGSKETEISIAMRDSIIGSNSIENAFENLKDKLEEAVDLVAGTETEGHTRSLTSTINVGAEYEILPNMLSAGALYSYYFGRNFNSQELSLMVTGTPLSWLSASVGYSFINKSKNAIGVALHIAPSKGVRLFLASDYVNYTHNSDYLPTNSKGLNFQTGISIPLGKKR